MKATELRIGNYYTYGFIKDLTKWDLTEFAEIYSDPEELKYWEPIPLTEEWLLKLGFDEDSIGHWWINEEDDFYGFVNRGEDGFMLVIAGEEHKETYVKHVHQLQNLYHALTGEELVTK